MNKYSSRHVRRLNLAQHWLGSFLLIVIANSLCSADPPRELRSLSGKYTVEMRDTILADNPDRDSGSTIVLLERDRVMTQVSTIGYLLDCYWTQDERYVTVNNRRANSGDYVWVFSLGTGKVVKRPDDLATKGQLLDYDAVTKAVVEKVTAKLPEFTWHTFLRRTTLAKGWQTPTQLRVDTSMLFSNSEGTWVLLSEVYEVAENKLQLRESKVSKQRPGE